MLWTKIKIPVNASREERNVCKARRSFGWDAMNATTGITTSVPVSLGVQSEINTSFVASAALIGCS